MVSTALPLRFIVFGVPRSGTSALVRALNLHPNVLCADELFHYRADHSRLRYPESFLASHRLTQIPARRRLQVLRAEAMEKDVLYVGNKSPRYYLVLPRINREIPGLQNLLIYRSPYGVLPSWDRKEREHRVAYWQAGAVGLFGFLDLLVCLNNATRQEGVFVFPYHFGLNESVEPIRAALDFIGADPAAFDEHTFVTKHLPKRATSKRRLEVQPYEREFLDAVGASELDEIFRDNWGVMTPGLVSMVSGYTRSIGARLPKAIDDAFRDADNPAALYYGARYVDLHRPELAELLELTKGSRFMSDVQRFGIPRRIRYAYLQRFFLRRRLTSLRLARTP